MKPFILKHHKVASDKIVALRAEEFDAVAGGMPKCPKGQVDTITSIDGAPGTDDGCDVPT